MKKSELRKMIKEELLRESKLNKDSIMFGGKPSYSFMVDKGQIDIWLNGGSPYTFSIDNEVSEKMNKLQRKVSKDIEKLAVDVAKFIEKEVGKIENKYKN